MSAHADREAGAAILGGQGDRDVALECLPMGGGRMWRGSVMA